MVGVAEGVDGDVAVCDMETPLTAGGVADDGADGSPPVGDTEKLLSVVGFLGAGG